MRISDWSSDVCSSDLRCASRSPHVEVGSRLPSLQLSVSRILPAACHEAERPPFALDKTFQYLPVFRSEEHTSELQSLMRISYAVFCLKKKKKTILHRYKTHHET